MKLVKKGMEVVLYSVNLNLVKCSSIMTPSQLNFYIQSMSEIFCMFCLKDRMNCWVHYLHTCFQFEFKQCVLLSQDIPVGEAGVCGPPWFKGGLYISALRTVLKADPSNLGAAGLSSSS